LLPGGSAWTFNNGGNLEKNYFFKPSVWENQPLLEKETFYIKLRETFFDILPRYFRAKQPIAMSLSSGLDTRVIMACLNNPPHELPCYTFGGMHRDTLDIRIANKVANACNQMHHVVRLDKKFFSNFPNYAEQTVYITDGCHDICGSYDIYFNEFARQIAPIRMTGKFGSEVLRNHSMLKKPINNSERLFHPSFKKYLQAAVRIFTDIKKGNNLSFAAFKEIPWYEHGRLAMELSKLTLRTPYMDNDLVKLMYQAPEDTRTSTETQLRLTQDYNPKLRKIMTDRGTAGNSNHFLSKCFQLLCYSLLKAEYIYLYQLPRWLVKLDYVLANMHLERLILGRYQFAHYRIWFRNELSDYVREILLDRRTLERSYLYKQFLEQMINSHLKGDRNYTNEINKIITVELIYRLLTENI
jgi:asparagine synthase (glutamine-hydrolysing)